MPGVETIFDYGWRILAVLVLVFLNGFFVAAEFALVKVRDTQLDALIKRGQRRALSVRQVIRRLDASLSACQLGITLTSLGLGWIGEPVFTRLLMPLLDFFNVTEHWRHWISFMVGFTAITFLHITAGEQAPKWLAIQKPLPVSLWVAGPLQWFHRLSYPFIWALNHASQWMLRQAGLQPVAEGDQAHSDEELRLLLATGHRRVDFSREIVLNAFDLKRRVAREVMRPRQQIVTLDIHATIAECLEVVEKTRYSRFPLCEDGEVDKTLGVLHIKDLYAARKLAATGKDLLKFARKMLYVPPTARLEGLLHTFLERKCHMALVVDEYGGVLGLITLENILEELVGQIQDEYDQEKPLVLQKAENVWVVDGALPLHELSELAGEPLTGEGIATASGWITQRLGGFPQAGDSITLSQCEITVTQMDGMRVAAFQLIRRPPSSPEESSPA
ncbi:MAG: hemolysin family protein [Verrucomicrobiae bacterium]|nr:hemolysin family protein [Verrucomicrobiae bacterium]